MKSLTVKDGEKDSFTQILFSGYKYFGKLRYYTTMQMGDKAPYQYAKIESLRINEKIKEKDFPTP